VQKFTRALTREIELAGQRLALDLDENGLSVRPVGSRRPPHEITWAALLCHMVKRDVAEPPPPEAHVLAEAVERLKAGGVAKKVSKTEPPPPPSSPPPAPLPAPSAERSSIAPTHALLMRLETWLRSHRPRFASGLLPGASEQDLATLKASLGTAPPDDLVTLLKWHNGQSLDFVGSFEGSWSLMSAARIAESGKELNGGIPFLDDGVGNFLYLDTTQAGGPVRDYRVGESTSAVVAPSLAAWLQDFVTRVEAAEYHEDPERGHFLRQRA
jgi:cell wall assembly regulator SMI1